MTETPNLAAALVAALADLTVVEKGRAAKIDMKGGGSYSYDYADIADVVKLTRPVLAEHGITALTPVHAHGNDLAVTVVFLHTSGEQMREGPFPFPHGRDAQATGSMVTYHRRYALVAALGMAAGDDDDGAAAAPRQQQAPAEPLATADTHEQIRSRIAGLSDGQMDTFAAWYKAQGFPPIKTADRLTVHQATEVLRHLQATPAEPQTVPDGTIADAAEKLHQRIDALPADLRRACEDALVAGFDGRFPNDLRPEDFPEAWMVVTDFEAKAGEGPSGGELAARAAAKGIHEEERVAR